MKKGFCQNIRDTTLAKTCWKEKGNKPARREGEVTTVGKSACGTTVGTYERKGHASARGRVRRKERRSFEGRGEKPELDYHQGAIRSRVQRGRGGRQRLTEAAPERNRHQGEGKGWVVPGS